MACQSLWKPSAMSEHAQEHVPTRARKETSVNFTSSAFNCFSQLYGGPIDCLLMLMRLLSSVIIERHTV